MAGIAQNRQKRLIFIVAPQIKNENERKVFKQEKKTCQTSNTPNTKIALSYQNIYGNSKMLIYHQLLNELLLKNVIKNTMRFLEIMSLRNST